MFAISIYRLSHRLHKIGVPLLPWILKSINRIVFATVVPPSATIGARVVLGYEGLGTVIHRRAVIESDVVIGPGVTIGGRSGHEGVPVIAQGALIGSGAKILGSVRVGRYASIGANAVVLQDVPDYGVAVGVPARLIRIDRPEDRPDYHGFMGS